MKYVLRLLIIIGLFSSTQINAQGPGNCWLNQEDGKYYNIDGSPCTNTVVTEVHFLRITPDARSGGMGDAGVAISADANALHYNASKLVLAEEDFSVSATYTPWLSSLGLNDVYLAYLSGYKKIDDLQAVGASLRYFSLGSIPFTDENGEALNVGQPNEFEVALAYSRKLSDNFTAGLTGKFIYSNLAAGQQVGSELIEAGVAGAIDRNLALGEVVEVVSDAMADIGVEEKDGSFTSAYEMGLIEADVMPFREGRLWNQPELERAFLPKVHAITVNKVHGSAASIEVLEQNYPYAQVESMEGAAFFFVGLQMNVHLLQLRAISNYVEPRNRATWKIEEAVTNLNEVLVEMLDSL